MFNQDIAGLGAERVRFVQAAEPDFFLLRGKRRRQDIGAADLIQPFGVGEKRGTQPGGDKREQHRDTPFMK